MVLKRLKPTRGISSLLHNGLLLALPLLVFLLVRLNQSQFTQLALILIILSKWRMFAVRPRFWAANIRANAVDLMVGISIVLFMTHTMSMALQLLWVVAYAIWLLIIKPSTSGFMIALQAGIGQLCALSALFVSWADGPIYGLTFLTGLFCFLAARHFFEAFDEGYSRMLSYLWGYFGAALCWLLSHWLLFYGSIAQVTVLLTALGYGIGVIYYWDHNEKLTKSLQRQFVAIMVALVLVVLIFSNWSSRVI